MFRAVVIALITVVVVAFVVSLSPHGGSPGLRPKASIGYALPLLPTPTPAAAQQTSGLTSVTVVEGTVATGPMTQEQAGRYASTQAGFPVRVPNYLPPGYVLTEIDIPASTPASIDSPSLPLHALLKGHNEHSGFNIVVSDVGYFLDLDSQNTLIWSNTDAEIYKNGDIYTFVSPRLYVAELTVGVRADPSYVRLPDDECVKVLTALYPQQLPMMPR